MVPKGWCVRSLDCAGITVLDGDRGKEYPKSTDFYDSGYCVFLSAKNVTKNGFVFDEVQFINEDKHLKLRKGQVKRGNLILTTRGTVGQFAYFDDSVPYEVMRINSGMVVLDVDQSDFSPDFFYALCRSEIIKKQVRSASFGSAQPQLTVGIIKGFKLPVPPASEQKKIAQILSAWDKAISTTEQLLGTAQKQKKALMQQLLTGKKRLQDKAGVRFDQEWATCTLNEIVDISTGQSKSKFITEDGDNFIIDMGSVSREGMLIPSKKTHLASDFLNAGQLVMPKDDIGGGNIIGRVGLIEENNKYVLADHVYVLDVKKSDSRFLCYLINSNGVNKSLRRKANGTAQLGLGKKDVLKQVLILPNGLEEQQKIAAVLSTADQEINILQQKLEALKQEKKALMQQLLTGKRRVKIDA